MKGIKIAGMKTIVQYLLENKELVALLSSIFIGFATIITSVISAYFVYQQTKIVNKLIYRRNKTNLYLLSKFGNSKMAMTENMEQIY